MLCSWFYEYQVIKNIRLTPFRVMADIYFKFENTYM
jgi:hypothetical protein